MCQVKNGNIWYVSDSNYVKSRYCNKWIKNVWVLTKNTQKFINTNNYVEMKIVGILIFKEQSEYITGFQEKTG